MKTRIITSIVALAVFVGVLLSPPLIFELAICAVVFVMLLECYKSSYTSNLVKGAGFVSAAMIMAALYESVYYADPIWDNQYFAIAIIITILLHMAVIISEHGKIDYNKVLGNGFLTLYITISMSCIVLAREEYGTSMMLLTFVCAWMTDTGAYFCGRAFGKRKLIPHVSPNKTVGGAVGGIIVSMVSCIIYLFICTKLSGAVAESWPLLILGGGIIGGVGAVFAQLGDLTASAIKRDTQIKDFGWIFPGHGGFMDRFDSVIYISPVIYLLLHVLIS